MKGVEGDIGMIESRWMKAFKYVGDLAKITGIIASFVGAIATGLQLFRDIKEGKEPSIMAFEAIEVSVPRIFVVTFLWWFGPVRAFIGK